MNPIAFSVDFQRLYCEPGIFESFSILHPVSFRRVLPFQYLEEGVDDPHLLQAEHALLAAPTEHSKRALVDEYARCGLLAQAEADALRDVIDFYDTDFFELMGMLYANADRFRCALRWYRERVACLENQNPQLSSDTESVYASVGYCLCWLGLYEEAIVWSKACLGPRQTADVVSRALLEYEAQLSGGTIRAVERAGPRTRYTVSSFEPERAAQTVPRLKLAMKTFAPFHDVYLDWVAHDAPQPTPCPDGYPFRAEYDAGTLVRHKMNLLFATCYHADALVARGYQLEAKRLLLEAAMLEPAAQMISERLRFLP